MYVYGVLFLYGIGKKLCGLSSSTLKVILFQCIPWKAEAFEKLDPHVEIHTSWMKKGIRNFQDKDKDCFSNLQGCMLFRFR